MTDRDENPPARDIIGQMSHELRTPLTSIIGFTELLLDDDSIDGEARDYLNIISEETVRLRESLQHYLSILRIERENGAPADEVSGQAAIKPDTIF